MFSTLSVASFAAFLSLVAGAATECEPGPPSAAPKLLQLGSHTETVTTETAQQIINKHFHGIPQGGSSVRSNLVAMNEGPQKKKHKTAAWACSSIDFANFHGTDGPKVRQIMETLKITEYCGLTEGNGTANSDSTCRAFWAGMRAHIELQNLNFIPVFENMAVVNWYAKEPGHFPSWGSDRDAVSVNYTQGKVTNFEIHRHNAVSPYAFCDIVYTVLRQNFDQAARAQCAPTAFLTALANVNPAGAIKRGLELYWTGKLEKTDLHAMDPQCDYIYHDMPPGIVPFEEGQPGTEVVGVLPVGCNGNAADCSKANGRPFTNSGIQGMWAIFFTTLFNGFRDQGDCKEEHRVVWVRYPGMNLQHELSIDDGFYPYHYNDFMRYTMGETRESGHHEYHEFPAADPLKAEWMLDQICASPHGAVVVMAGNMLLACTKDERFQHGMGSSPQDPFELDGSTLKCGDQAPWDPDVWLINSPDHAVYVDQCYPNGAVSIWTWTGRLYLHRSALLGWGVTQQNELCVRAPALWGGIIVPSWSGNLALEATVRRVN